eukprot:COSAG05_NODE_660_length_8054_cov_3.180264_9_plen_124_part_00
MFSTHPAFKLNTQSVERQCPRARQPGKQPTGHELIALCELQAAIPPFGVDRRGTAALGNLVPGRHDGRAEEERLTLALHISVPTVTWAAKQENAQHKGTTLLVWCAHMELHSGEMLWLPQCHC